MSLLDKIKIYNEIKEEEKKLLDERKFREKVISNLEEKLNLKIEYPGVESTEKEMKKGSRVRHRGGRGIGIITNIDRRLPYPIYVKFDDGYTNPYMEESLKLAYTEEELKQIKEKNKEIIDEFYKQPFNLFKGYLKQQVEEINSKEFKVGDKVRLNANANRYPVTKEGSEGKIVEYCGNEIFNVDFIKIPHKETRGAARIHQDCIEYLKQQIPKKDSEKLVQESIDYVKKTV